MTGWRAGQAASVRSVGQSPGEVVSQAQPSPDGQELAEVFTNEDGDAEAIEVVAVVTDTRSPGSRSPTGRTGRSSAGWRHPERRV